MRSVSWYLLKSRRAKRLGTSAVRTLRGDGIARYARLLSSAQQGAQMLAQLAGAALSPSSTRPPEDPMRADAGREQPKPRDGSDSAAAIVAEQFEAANAYARRARAVAFKFVDAFADSLYAAPQVDFPSVSIPDVPELTLPAVPEPRVISWTCHLDGVVVVQVGDESLTLSEAECRVLERFFHGRHTSVTYTYSGA